MTQEEIIEMARQAGFEGCAELTWENVICTEELEAFAKLVADAAVAKEREACAKIVDDWFHSLASEPEMEKIAEQIRARGQE